MSGSSNRPSSPTIRDLRRELAEASNPKLLKIVAAVDAFADRGSADELISPIRARLAKLQPPRRLGFSRLLFIPFGALIVPASRWRPGSPAFPRTAIVPMANAVRAAMGPSAAPVDARITGRTTADTELVTQLGRVLWPAAARFLAAAGPPAGWGDTGLNDRQFRNLARIAAAVLAQAPALDALQADTANGLLPPRVEAMHAILQGAADVSEIALPMVLSLLLTRLPDAAKILVKVYAGMESSGIPAALEQAYTLLVDQLETAGPAQRIASGTLVAASATARGLDTLLTHLAHAARKAERRARVDRIRAALDSACRARFQAALEQDLVARLHDPAALALPGALSELERTARGLRILETEARAIGGGRIYDRLLAQAALLIRSADVAERIGRADRMRLVEILEGPEAALAMMRAGH